MTDRCESCSRERVHEVEYRVLSESLKEVKDRVSRVETALGRGVLLLMANLVGMVISLAEGFVRISPQ